MKKIQPWPGRIAVATIRVSQPGCQSARVIDDPLAIDAKATGLSTVMRDARTMVMFAGTPYAHLHIGGSQRGEMNIAAAIAVFGR